MCHTSLVVFVILITAACLGSAAPSGLDPHEVLIWKTNFPPTRHLNKRDLPVIAETDLLKSSSEFADKDFDMELAEVNVFRPVFRYRASYARRGR